MILILAQNDDLHADAVFSYIKDNKVKVAKFDPSQLLLGNTFFEEDLCNKSFLTINNEGAVLELENGQTISTNEVEAVFNRMFYFESAPKELSTAEHLAVAECTTAVKTFFSILPKNCFWMNNPYVEDAVDNKLFQQRLAKEFGFNIPDTLITNNAKSAKEFFKKHNNQVIIKQLSAISIIENPETATCENDLEVYGFSTVALDEKALENIEEYLFKGGTPAFFQKNIKKITELRVTVAGNSLIAYRIHSQDDPESITDFRRSFTLFNEKVELNEDLKSKLIRYVKELGVHFSAIDLIEAEDGKIYFLEANVQGNWLWLELGNQGSEIASMVANELIAGAYNKNNLT